ncbi:MAG: antibiotic biosynthesis monooxygenase [Gluconacetobacter diazotrophicus]|nr:antibiotic biosynthesis monooxygenase [Gluconacetobacter diazotrophicus]
MAARTIVARFHAKPGHAEQVEPLLRGFVEPSRAEDGCLFYDLYRDAADPDLFVILDAWRDHAAFEAHASTDNVARTLAALEPLLREPPAITQLDPLS